MRLAAGTRLGPYEIVGLLGAGGMGEVYKARDPRIGRDVAIKVLPAGFAADADRLRRFEQEARATGALNHPNLLALYDVGTSDSGPYLVSELLDGQSLRDRLSAGPVALQDALDWVTQMAQGLSAAHGRGVVHRDLKPENVFLLRDRRVKLLDFGLAKLDALVGPAGPATATAQVATSAGVTLGTVGYMAPEQVRGDPIGPAADIFALGALLYELVAGRPAFRHRTSVETLHAILKEDPPPLSSASPAVERVISRCLEKDAGDRFQSAADVAFALGALAPAAPQQATPGSRAGVLRPVMVTAAGALLLGAVAMWLLTRGRGDVVPQSTPASLSASRMTPFLSSAALEREPAWSPTGDLIAYVSDAAGNDDIWIADPSGANPLNLTAAFAGVDAWPAWSPDGLSVAFYSERDGGGIYTMTALGANVRRVVPLKRGVLYTFSLNWARDASLVYTGFDADGFKRVYRVPATGGEPACVTCAWQEVTDARAGELSPSGVHLAFLSGLMGPRADLYVAHLPSGRVRKVTNQADTPHWSPDGRHIVFISNRDGQADLWQLAIDPDGSPVGDVRKVTSALGATTFALAPDGKQILAVKEESTSHLWSVPLSVGPVTDLKAASQLTSGVVRDQRGRWSADGRSIFFESVRRGGFDIWRVDVAGDNLVRLTTAAGSELRPRPSPRGDWVAFDVVDARGEFTHVMRPDGSQVHALDEDWFGRYSQVCCGDWSQDGSRLTVTVTTRDKPSRTTVAVVSIDRPTGTATATRLLSTLLGGAPEYGRWSPDGRAIVYEALTDGSWDLWIVDPDAPTPRRLTTTGGNDRQAEWQKQPRALFFLQNSREVWRMPFDETNAPAGAAERWLVPPGRLTLDADGLDINPAGDRLLVTVAALASDIWLVELR
jgi:Tol biopolymer transport system component